MRNIGFYLLIIFIAITFIDYFSVKTTTKQEMGYSAFLQQVDKGEVAKVTLMNNVIEGVLTDGTEFVTVTPDAPNDDATLLQRLQDKKVEIRAKNPPEPPWWTAILSSVLPILLLVGVWFFVMQQTQGGGGRMMSFGRSHARMSSGDKVKVNFGDVAGADEAKQELEEVVEFLRQPKKFNDLGARIPKGVLLFGPPGTGKTLLARAVAGEAGVPFFSISGSDFIEMFVGVGASRVRDLFEQGKKSAPCIIFIDEIDSVGQKRNAGGMMSQRVADQTLNAMLVEMDGFGTNDGVIVIAATNRPDILDPALLRPGRFDRQVNVDLPTLKGREAILAIHAAKVKLADDVDLERLARGTSGHSGADLANIINEAALLSARKGLDAIPHAVLEEARDKVFWGSERKSAGYTRREYETTAWHEAGHALLQLLLPNADPLHKVSIIPRGRALGVTMSLPEKDVLNRSKSYFLDAITMCCGGRIGEQHLTKDVSTGAAQDIAYATQMARGMVCRFGMSDAFGFQAFIEPNSLSISEAPPPYSQKTAEAIDQEVRRIIEDCYSRAAKLIKQNRDKLELLATTLLEKETMDGRDVEKLLGLERKHDDVDVREV